MFDPRGWGCSLCIENVLSIAGCLETKCVVLTMQASTVDRGQWNRGKSCSEGTRGHFFDRCYLLDDTIQQVWTLSIPQTTEMGPQYLPVCT